MGTPSVTKAEGLVLRFFLLTEADMQVSFQAKVCTVRRKRLQGRSQTFAGRVANVCGKKGIF